MAFDEYILNKVYINVEGLLIFQQVKMVSVAICGPRDRHEQSQIGKVA